MHQHYPDALDRRGPESELGTSGNAAGRGPDGVRLVDAPSPAQSHQPQNGPIAIGSSCQRVTPACCSTACYSSPDTTLTWTISSNSANGEAALRDIPSMVWCPGQKLPPVRWVKVLGTRWDWQSRSAGWPPHSIGRATKW